MNNIAVLDFMNASLRSVLGPSIGLHLMPCEQFDHKVAWRQNIQETGNECHKQTCPERSRRESAVIPARCADGGSGKPVKYAPLQLPNTE
jgi:hypothetical protein